MIWSCKEVLRVMKLEYIRIGYQYELHQGSSSKYGFILNKPQNDYFDGSSECSLERFLRMVLSTVTFDS